MDTMSKGKKFFAYVGLGLTVVIFALVAATYSLPQNKETSGVSQGSLLMHRSGSAVSDWGVPEDSFAPPSTPAPMMSMPDFGNSSGSKSEVARTESRTKGAVTATPRKVIKEGALELLVKKAEEAAEQSAAIASGLGGYVENKNIYNVSTDSKAGTITLKVPAAKFDEALKQLKAIAVKVDREEVGTADVTSTYVDMEARLASLKAEEAQYLTVLKGAKEVGDILNVTEHLSSVRSDVERMEAALKELSGDVEMSSIAVTFTEEADVRVFGIEWKPLFQLKQAFRDMLEGLAGFINAMITFVFFLPVLVLWIAVFVVGLWVVRKIFGFIKRKFFSPPLP